MRILLDECVDVHLRHELPGHEVETVTHMGWAGVKNGKLLRRAAESGRFDIFLTVDKSLPSQNVIEALPFAVVVFRGVSNDIVDMRPLLPEFLRRVGEFEAGHVYVLA